MAIIGVLALQGNFAEHLTILKNLGSKAVTVKYAYELEHIHALIIPGGESTTIAKLTTGNGGKSLVENIRLKAQAGMPVYGTCMGAVFLAKEIEGSTQGRLGLMDIKIRRNAFGPQKFSRQQAIAIPVLGDEPYPAVFIRAPIISACGPHVEVLAAVTEGTIMARQSNILVTAFHPELTSDIRVHKYFLAML